MLKLSKIELISILFSIMLITTIILTHLTIPTPLFSSDGQNHYKFINTLNCESNYSTGICLMLQPFQLNELGVWFVFLLISLLIPLLLIYYTKKIIYFLFNFWYFLQRMHEMGRV